MCIAARERIKGREKDTCAALIGHGQTMYSACFILSRFINVNIFHLPRSHYPFIPSPYPGPFSCNKSPRLIDRSNRDVPSFWVTILYFLAPSPNVSSLSFPVNLLTLSCEILSG